MQPDFLQRYHGGKQNQAAVLPAHTTYCGYPVNEDAQDKGEIYHQAKQRVPVQDLMQRRGNGKKGQENAGKAATGTDAQGFQILKVFGFVMRIQLYIFPKNKVNKEAEDKEQKKKTGGYYP